MALSLQERIEIARKETELLMKSTVDHKEKPEPATYIPTYFDVNAIIDQLEIQVEEQKRVNETGLTAEEREVRLKELSNQLK